MIKASELIAKFKQALSDHWGYIWGTAGELWTQEKQKALEKTKDENRAMGRKYGSKWIGHRVADCSGLFYWAFKQLGGYMYHGSNTMWDKYCEAQGELKKGKRTDGKELLPGTAVFTYNKTKKKRGHVGCFVGDGTVIEAASTTQGVITSKITASKWVEWGELQGVDYGKQPEPVPKGKYVVTGKNVALREGPNKSRKVMTRIATGTIVDKGSTDGWTYVRYGKAEGFMMNDFIEIHTDFVKVTGKNVALRVGVSTGTQILARIATGTSVPRVSLPKEWECISYGGKTGFMMKEFLKGG